MAKDNSSKLDQAQKKPATKKEEYFTSMKNYVVDTLISGLKILIWFIIALIIIYTCKVVQANVLPTDVNCYPYTKEVHNPTPIQTNIFTNLPFSNPRKSMKMSFEPENTSINDLIKSYIDYEENPESTPLGNYFNSLQKSLLSKNYSYYNFVLSALNTLPEFLLVIIGPFIGFFILMIGIILNTFYFTWYWFSNLSWLFKKNANIEIKEDGSIDYGNKPPKWVNYQWNVKETGQKDINKSEWGSIVFAYIKSFGFVMLFSMIFPFLWMYPLYLNISCIISFFGYSMKLENKDASFTDLFKYFFRYNKLIIMAVFSYYVIFNASTHLGTTQAVFAALTIFLIYYLKIIEMFVPVGGEDSRTTPLASDKQAKKVPCEKGKPQTEGSASTKGAGPMPSGPSVAPGPNPAPGPTTSTQETRETSNIPSPPEAVPPQMPQSGGIKVNKKIKQVGGNLINELKKFNKKYAQFLL